MHDVAAAPWAFLAWMDDAAGTGRPRLFFPPPAERPEARARREARARTVCEACPALLACRAFARRHREYGFWGGESEQQRADAGYPAPAVIGARTLRRRRAAEAGKLPA
jgi:WhiB family redox-sensing transcriptional regulator